MDPWAHTLIGVAAGFLFAVYFGDSARLTLPFSSRYRDLFGRYKMYNHSRERTTGPDGTLNLIEWDVTISRRSLQCPRIVLRHKGLYAVTYAGDLFVEGPYVFVRARRTGDRERRHDFMALTLRRSSRTAFAEVAFMAGFRDAPVPASCVHLLCTPGLLTPAEVREVLGAADFLAFQDYDERLDRVLLRGDRTGQPTAS